MTTAVAFTMFTAVAAIALLGAEWRRLRWLKVTSKPLASAGFIGVALASGATQSDWGWALLAALALSWLGDVLLLWRSQACFLGGLVAFLLGHIGFAVAFAIRGVDPMVVAIAGAVVAVLAVLIGRCLLPQAPAKLRVPIVAYICVISVMVAMAFGTAAALPSAAIAGASVAFFLSDMGVAVDRFVSPGFTAQAFLLPLYYGAQLVFAWSVA